MKKSIGKEFEDKVKKLLKKYDIIRGTSGKKKLLKNIMRGFCN